MWKTVEAMTLTECETEAASLASYFERCHEIGQGINTKEGVRFRQCCARLRAAGWSYIPESPYCRNGIDNA